jgi:hypothetical protein
MLTVAACPGGGGEVLADTVTVVERDVEPPPPMHVTV